MSTIRIDAAETLDDEQAFTSSRPLDYVPGILLPTVMGLLGNYAQILWNALAKHEHWRVPDIEYVLWAIVIGLLITNTACIGYSSPVCRPTSFGSKSGRCAGSALCPR